MTRNPSGQAVWEFSLRIYAEPGVQEECLALQERLRLDVNLLLFCAYAGAKRGIALSQQDIADMVALTAGWQDSVVRSLRAVRSTMKPAIGIPVARCRRRPRDRGAKPWSTRRKPGASCSTSSALVNNSEPITAATAGKMRARRPRSSRLKTRRPFERSTT